MIDMPALVSQHISIVPSGSVYKAQCPIHHEKTGMSFVVYQDHAYCFGKCSRSFSPVDFLMVYLGLTYKQAKAKLEDQPAIILPTFAKQIKEKVPGKHLPGELIIYWTTMLSAKRRDYFHSRLFTDETIDRECWGHTGHRYVITVWDGEPGKSSVVSVRLRADKGIEPKYIGFKNFNDKVLYNLYNAQHLPAPYVMVFFGEFDSALAYQDGFPAITPTNGQNSWDSDWDKHFYDGPQFIFNSQEIIVIPDKGEERRAFQLASRFIGSARVFFWPEGNFDDYNSFRLAGGTAVDFRGMVFNE